MSTYEDVTNRLHTKPRRWLVAAGLLEARR